MKNRLLECSLSRCVSEITKDQMIGRHYSITYEFKVCVHLMTHGVIRNM